MTSASPTRRSVNFPGPLTPVGYMRPAIRLVIGCWLLALSLPAAAAEPPALRPFSASYDLYRGSLHVAVTELKLQRAGSDWRFSLLTRARGLFAWFVDEQPYAETTFFVADGQVLLREITIGDAATGENHEAASFDWDASRLDVERKGKSRQLELNGGVYDYQSIHVLAASMSRQQLQQATIDFYRKGKLKKANLVYDGEQKVDVNGESIDASVYAQVTSQSGSKMKYFYDPLRPVLPLRVERHEEGESPSVLALREVEWGL